jgi:hypothetical protein
VVAQRPDWSSGAETAVETAETLSVASLIAKIRRWLGIGKKS